MSPPSELIRARPCNFSPWSGQTNAQSKFEQRHISIIDAHGPRDCDFLETEHDQQLLTVESTLKQAMKTTVEVQSRLIIMRNQRRNWRRAYLKVALKLALTERVTAEAEARKGMTAELKDLQTAREILDPLVFANPAGSFSAGPDLSLTENIRLFTPGYSQTSGGERAVQRQMQAEG